MQHKQELGIKGFSLAEVLVVISIIVLLAALLFTAFAPARAQAKHASCSGQMRQLYMALMQYSTDYDADTAYPELHGLTYFTTVGIKQALHSYGLTDSQWICPSAPDLKGRFWSTYGFAAIVYENSPTDPMFQFKRRAVQAREKEYGTKSPLISCPIHDMREIQPTDNDPLCKKDPWLIWVDGTGAVKSGRCPMITRTYPFGSK